LQAIASVFGTPIAGAYSALEWMLQIVNLLIGIPVSSTAGLFCLPIGFVLLYGEWGIPSFDPRSRASYLTIYFDYSLPVLPLDYGEDYLPNYHFFFSSFQNGFLITTLDSSHWRTINLRYYCLVFGQYNLIRLEFKNSWSFWNSLFFLVDSACKDRLKLATLGAGSKVGKYPLFFSHWGYSRQCLLLDSYALSINGWNGALWLFLMALD